MPAIVYRIALAALSQEPVEILLSLEEVEESKRAVRIKIMEIVEKCGIDIDKPIILDSNGLYAIEHIYKFEDGEGEYESLNDCLVIDICG